LCFSFQVLSCDALAILIPIYVVLTSATARGSLNSGFLKRRFEQPNRPVPSVNSGT